MTPTVGANRTPAANTPPHTHTQTPTCTDTCSQEVGTEVHSEQHLELLTDMSHCPALARVAIGGGGTVKVRRGRMLLAAAM